MSYRLELCIFNDFIFKGIQAIYRCTFTMRNDQQYRSMDRKVDILIVQLLELKKTKEIKRKGKAKTVPRSGGGGSLLQT